MFDIPAKLGYQVFSPSMPLRKVGGCETRNYISDLLLLETKFVTDIGDTLDNVPEVHLINEKLGP